MADKAFTSLENGSLFIQPDGPNTRPLWLGCYDVDDVTESLGSVNPLYCIDENGKYVVVGTTQDPPDIITFSLGTYTGKRKEALESVQCPAPVYLVLRDCGKASLFDNFVRVAIIDVVKVQSRTFAGWVKREEDGAAMTTFEVAAAPPIIDGVRLQAYEQSIDPSLGEGSDITFCNDVVCAGPCGDVQGVCEDGFAALNPVPLSSATIVTTTGGAIWATAATPFVADEDISAVTCVRIDSTTVRKFATRGTSDAANPAEIAYSDDNWGTLTNVDVGAINAQFITSMFALNKRNIWVGCEDGYMYFSDDAGITWSILLNGTLTANSIDHILFKDEYTGVAVTDSDAVLSTNDGGISWSVGSTGTTSDLLTVEYNGLFWWIGTSSGELLYSIDRTTWTERKAWAGQGTGSVTDIGFANKFIGWITHNDLAVDGSILMTVDGGYNWSQLDVPNNNGFAALTVCGSDLAYAVGTDSSGDGFVVRIYTT